MQIVENAKVVYESKKHINNITDAIGHLVKAGASRTKASKELSEEFKSYGSYIKEVETTSQLG